MDLNQLYFDHQIALMRGSAAVDAHIRAARRSEAADIARRIERHLRALGAKAAHGWEVPYLSVDQAARPRHV